MLEFKEELSILSFMDNAIQLQTYGIEPTDKRELVYSLFKNSTTPLSVSMLLRLLSGAHINRATVFRIVKLFEIKQLIKRIDLVEGELRFEIASLPHHHHAHCRTCGAVEIVDVCITEGAKTRVKRSLGFEVLDHSLILFGVCKKCKELV